MYFGHFEGSQATRTWNLLAPVQLMYQTASGVFVSGGFYFNLLLDEKRTTIGTLLTDYAHTEYDPIDSTYYQQHDYFNEEYSITVDEPPLNTMQAGFMFSLGWIARSGLMMGMDWRRSTSMLLDEQDDAKERPQYLRFWLGWRLRG